MRPFEYLQHADPRQLSTDEVMFLSSALLGYRQAVASWLNADIGMEEPAWLGERIRLVHRVLTDRLTDMAARKLVALKRERKRLADEQLTPTEKLATLDKELAALEKMIAS